MIEPRYIDMTGQKFHHLLVLEYAGNKKWWCKCDCGTVKKIARRWLIGENTKSCGCMKSEIISQNHKKYDNRNKKLYNVYHSMLSRCNNPNHRYFEDYGARGIKVCEEWSNFESFQTWALEHGYEEGLSIERIDNDKGYSPDNCKWISMCEQHNNNRTSARYVIDGEELTLADISRKYNINYHTLKSRRRKGLSGLELIKPIRGAKK